MLRDVCSETRQVADVSSEATAGAVTVGGVATAMLRFQGIILSERRGADAVRAFPRHLSSLIVSHSEPVLRGVFLWT
jgi:hypothetical protein